MAKQFETVKNALVVYLSGEVDQYAAAELKEKIDIEIENSPKRNLIFELSEVSLMDSSGIGLIVGRYKIVNALGGKVLICGGSKSIKKMIELSGIGKIVKSFENLEIAEKSLRTSNKSERNEENE